MTDCRGNQNHPLNLPDTRIPPPPLPPGYKTLLYPAYSDKLSSKLPAAKQMKTISLNRRSGEEPCTSTGSIIVTWISET